MTHPNPRLHLRVLTQRGIFLFLLISAVASLGYLGWKNRIQWDITQNERNSLSAETVELLREIEGPLLFTVYATAQDAQFGNVTDTIRRFLAPYQRAKPDISVRFIDPNEQPELARDAGIEISGQMVIEFNGRRDHLTTFNEQELTNLLMRVARPAEKLVIALGGHGERKLDGIADHDLGEFGKHLTTRGFRIRTLNLAVVPDVPKNTSVLLISSPRSELAEGEVDKVLAYVARGGSLLWLVDQGSLHGLQPLAEKLELTLTPGVVIDPQARQLRVPETFSIGTRYGFHAVTRNFDYLTMFPFARQIVISENGDWHNVPLVDAGQGGWVETGKLDGGIAFDPMYDVSGPVCIAAALSRTSNDREQRIAVIGSGHFLANAYLGRGKNLDFGINLVNWLAGDENLIMIQPRTTLDASLALEERTLSLIAWVVLVVMPLVFLVGGGMIWWKRRKN